MKEKTHTVTHLQKKKNKNIIIMSEWHNGTKHGEKIRIIIKWKITFVCYYNYYNTKYIEK